MLQLSQRANPRLKLLCKVLKFAPPLPKQLRRDEAAATHFTLQLKHSARNPADACDTGTAVSISVSRGVNHLDFPKRPYGFVYNALAARVLHP